MSEDQITILLAEDNDADVFLVREALRTHGLTVNLHVVQDGEAAIQFIQSAEESDNASYPALALLDLNLPRKSGSEVLARLRRSTKFGDIPVTVISSSRSPVQVSEDSKLDADRFFTKPSDYKQFMYLGAIVRDLLRQRMNANI